MRLSKYTSPLDKIGSSKTVRGAICFSIVALAILPSVSFAKQKKVSNDSALLLPLISVPTDPQFQDPTVADPQPQASTSDVTPSPTPSDTSIQATASTTASSTSQTHVDQTATTTDAANQTQLEEIHQIHSVDPADSNLQNLLNTAPSPSSHNHATTTQKNTLPTKTTTFSPTSTTATTTAGTVAPTTGGGTGLSQTTESIPAPAAYNYYPLFDGLNPQATYSLSFLSLVLGIVGALLIIKDPRESPAWVRGLGTRQPLFEP